MTLTIVVIAAPMIRALGILIVACYSFPSRSENRFSSSRSAIIPQPINIPSQKHSKADVDPMELDPSITWDSVGGLGT